MNWLRIELTVTGILNILLWKEKNMNYVLYYTHGARGRETLWYARKAPGDGGVDWEITKDPELAGTFTKRYWQAWCKLRGSKAGWRLVP